jgi:hypothetical protein
LALEQVSERVGREDPRLRQTASGVVLTAPLLGLRLLDERREPVRGLDQELDPDLRALAEAGRESLELVDEGPELREAQQPRGALDGVELAVDFVEERSLLLTGLNSLQGAGDVEEPLQGLLLEDLEELEELLVVGVHAAASRDSSARPRSAGAAK